MIYYVDCKAALCGDGRKERPFRSIQEAADIALPGDEVLVEPGVYREYVRPRHAGRADARITYRSVEPRGAVITGAEPVTDWTPYEGAADGKVYTARIPNALFGGFNPYTVRVRGDWFVDTMVAHLGEVYLDDQALYEVTSLERVLHPTVYRPSWEPEATLHTWYTEQDAERDETVLYANFGTDPTGHKVEINVRRACFAPEETGIGYITLSGFTVTKAACQWAPPTAYQEGMIAPHWSRGWIIEDCEISHAKCSGISLGKYLQPQNENKWLNTKWKDGAQTQRECVMQALNDGWTKENVGHHIVRRCEIHDCGQTGIVGHMGGVFSRIEDNHIYRINIRQNLSGAEIGGIKMHAAIDVVFRHNHIHHCTRGIWLDWQAQGTRVTGNLFHDNALSVDGELNQEQMGGLGEDIFIEISHGPTLVDHNFLLSERAAKIPAQGLAFVHNLIAGSLSAVGVGTNNGTPHIPSPRYTPYHVPHDVKVAGFMTVLHGDDRFVNNIFVQQKVREPLVQMAAYVREHPNDWDDFNVTAGTAEFDAGNYPTVSEWKARYEGYCGMGSETTDRYYDHLPVQTRGNVYLGGAKPWCKEQHPAVREDCPVTFALEKKDGTWKLQTNLYALLPEVLQQAPAGYACTLADSDTLGEAFEPEERFENPDGSPIVFSSDAFGQDTGLAPLPGPLADGGELLNFGWTEPLEEKR